MHRSTNFNIEALKFVDLVLSSFLCLMYSVYIFKVLDSLTVHLFLDFAFHRF